jgi:hypothetical protein
MIDDQIYTVVTSRGNGLCVLRQGALKNVNAGVKRVGGGVSNGNVARGQRVMLMTGLKIKEMIEAQRREGALAISPRDQGPKGPRKATDRFSPERRQLLEVLKSKPDGFALVPLSTILGKKPPAVCNLMRIMARDGGLVRLPDKKGGVWTITQAGLAKIA